MYFQVVTHIMHFSNITRDTWPYTRRRLTKYVGNFLYLILYILNEEITQYIYFRICISHFSERNVPQVLDIENAEEI